MPGIVEKVTAFITRESRAGPELLLFEHPYAGIQIPAGTVEEGEQPAEAALREAAEETGLTTFSICRYLGCQEDRLSEEQRIIAAPTRVYARPDVTSFDWAYLRSGITVTVNRSAGRFSQITYKEFDRVPAPQYVTLRITGWVPDDVLASIRRRHFFHLAFHGHAQARWTVHSDNHDLALFWAPLADLPEIIHPQDTWLAYLPASGSTGMADWP
jgi:8-oxo-dGTP pyrophosphatase MutT (NUDIX family)